MDRPAHDNGALYGRWCVSEAHGPVEAYTVSACPSLTPAFVEFGSDGLFLGYDAINATTGRFVRIPSGFYVVDGQTTLKGYFGADPAIKLVRRVMVAIASGRHVAARLSDHVLSLGVGDLALVCGRASD